MKVQASHEKRYAATYGIKPRFSTPRKHSILPTACADSSSTTTGQDQGDDMNRQVSMVRAVVTPFRAISPRSALNSLISTTSVMSVEEPTPRSPVSSCDDDDFSHSDLSKKLFISAGHYSSHGEEAIDTFANSLQSLASNSFLRPLQSFSADIPTFASMRRSEMGRSMLNDKETQIQPVSEKAFATPASDNTSSSVWDSPPPVKATRQDIVWFGAEQMESPLPGRLILPTLDD